MKYKSYTLTQVIQLLEGLLVVGLFGGVLAIIAFTISFLVLRWP